MGRNFRRNNYVTDGRRYEDHDDRGFDKGRIKDRLGHKQVGFVDGVRGGNIQKRNRGGNSRALNHVGLLPDEDLDLDVEVRTEQAGRGRPVYGMRSWRGNRRGGFGSRMPAGGMAPGRNAFSWQKVTLKNGAKYDKIFMLKELVQRSSVKFVPICYLTNNNNNNATFFVEEQEAGRAIKELDKVIEMPDGFHLQISIERTTPPNIPVSDSLVEKIKLGMSDRFNVATSALNLNSFHKSFAGEAFFAPLWRTNILSKVVEIVTEHIPDVVAIDMSSNKIMNIDALVPFKHKLQKLSILYLKDNKLTDTRGLEKLKGLKLVELKMDGNPIKDRLGSVYTDSLRKIFPSLQVLDGKVLPKEIGFDDDGEGTSHGDMPQTLPKLIKSVEAGNLVLQFLEQYFKLYDSDSRQPLLDAYDENAMMSMTAWGPYETMKAYIEESRNLIRVASEARKIKLLHKGRLPIVSFLTLLPKTQHDPTTFTLDLPFTSPTLMIFTVCGMFKERDTKTKAIRHFNRCFIVAPRGSGFCIINETLFVSNPTAANAKKAFTSAESSMQAISKPPPSVSDTLDLASKQTLATAFSEMSGMNLDWSARCLQENQWNYDAASKVFQDLKTGGKVPPEAFIKS